MCSWCRCGMAMAAERDAADPGGAAGCPGGYGADGSIGRPKDVFRWVESQRIRLSFAHDPLFAVSMSGVRGLPHQIEADGTR